MAETDKISITMAYYNRRPLLEHTIKSILKSSVTNIELVIVDDGSHDEHRLEDLQKQHDFMKLIRVEPEDKDYINPCVPFNMAFKAATGDVVIIQNPESFHVGDLVAHARTIKDKEYFSYACYSLDQSMTNKLLNASGKFSLSDFVTRNGRIISTGGQGWYNHSTHRPVRYHFASAIRKEFLDEIGGFDERFAHGLSYDDDVLLLQLERAEAEISIIDNPMVFHMWHFDSVAYPQNEFPNKMQLVNENKALLEQIRANEV